MYFCDSSKSSGPVDLNSSSDHSVSSSVNNAAIISKLIEVSYTPVFSFSTYVSTTIVLSRASDLLSDLVCSILIFDFTVFSTSIVRVLAITAGSIIAGFGRLPNVLGNPRLHDLCVGKCGTQLAVCQCKSTKNSLISPQL